MKKLIALLLIVFLAAALAACSGTSEPATAPAPTEPAPQLHTVAPSEAATEPEWVNVDCELSLEDNDNYYAKGDDFVCFAIVGSEDDATLCFKLDDVTAAMLRDQSPDIEYYITLNDKKIGGAQLSDDCTEVTLVGDYSYDEICELATKIRGL